MIVAQITDLHVGPEIATAQGPVDPCAALDRAVAHLNALDPRPDLVLATGDLTQQESAAEYALVKAGLAGLEMPVYVLPGNHDDRGRLRAAFAEAGYLPAEGEFLHYVIEDGALRIIALDSHDPGKVSGALCAARLAWLDSRLAEAPDRPTLIALHHPPFATGIPIFDRIGCRDGAALGKVVARHPQIERILCGHVHRPIDVRWCGTVVSVTPSTAYQYPLELREGIEFTPIVEPAACRICCWTPGAGLVSHLSYIGA